jgi:hypothetical protein
MFKKIILGALLVGLIGVLIVGAVVRTNAKAGDGAGNAAGGRGRAVASTATEAESGGQYGGRWQQTDQTVLGGGQGGRGQGGGQGTTAAEPAPLADATTEDWLTVQGTVLAVADDLVEIQSSTGDVIPLEGRPLSFAQEQGFSLKVGEAVELAGFDEDGEFKIGQVTSLSSGASITLRDVSGRPGWAGRGRRGQPQVQASSLTVD